MQCKRNNFKFGIEQKEVRKCAFSGRIAETVKDKVQVATDD